MQKEITIAHTPSFYEKLVLDVFTKMPYGNLTLTLPSGESLSIGNGTGNISAAIHVTHPDFFKRVVLYGDIGFGEAFTDGLWETPNITNVIKWFILNIEYAPSVSGSKIKSVALNTLKFFNKLQHLAKANSVQQSKQNIAEHYDLNNDFFKLFLDTTMTYSSAYFNEQNLDLATAQLAKYDRLCKQLQLKSTDHVLEIGSGWGGNAIYMAKNYGCKVTSITISEEQYKLAIERVKEAGLADKVEIKLTDYRLLEGKYDKIVSIEMLEAVGYKYFDAYFLKCHELLKKNGLLALQVITCPDSRFESLRKGVDWIQKHIFPGSLLPSVSAINTAINNTSDLTLIDLKEFGLDYAQTLAAWRSAFNANIDSVKKLNFNDSFIRKWNYYFSYCEAAFAMRNINVMQLVYSRPNNTTL